MSGGALVLMAAVGLVAIAVGLVLLARAPSRTGEAARYVSRLAAVMFVAVGLCLELSVVTWIATA